MLQTKIVEKIKTRILCSETFYSENRAVYGKCGKNMVQQDTSQTTI